MNDAVAIIPLDEGVVKAILGVSKFHGDCTELAISGIVSLINPPRCTRPCVVKVTVAVSAYPGVSVAVANEGPEVRTAQSNGLVRW